MAKSVRASVTKRNRAKLRAAVFGPAVDARTERLSAKLQELASQPITREHGNSSMELDSTKTGIDMDVDKGTVEHTRSRAHKSDRIQKRKKPRSSIVFRPHPSKAKKSSKRK
ncbi:DUF2423 domain-containing protein [Aspergillus clavatus NRRL 1]|uniref:DUF2423 domain-containing protein n=1 Tax=Aspergillus clavatus (strain ATCC 1007 / CBS 513.65 / DSM 816 / NCTC 3887 / NRRL 1 / QM 1276 / 107) TaxID=344612 RepID=A1CM09_ASPCL|nr:uncharacterized protein ACLA_095290 [Aspergillus clavatus NRRL 1]EAW08596.1 conserved hypothetical protein [Aspergillus clavatus NRRL 1]